jgi:hypothetical protein
MTLNAIDNYRYILYTFMSLRIFISILVEFDNALVVFYEKLN